MNYEALVLMSAAVWRLIATVREPVLYPMRDLLVKKSAKYGNTVFSGFVWLMAFALGMSYATMAGVDGDMLNALGWTDGYEFVGYGMTALAIASGSAGLRVAEKVWELKTEWEDVDEDTGNAQSDEDTSPSGWLQA